MDTLIKEGDSSLIAVSGDKQPSDSILDKYENFIQGDDSDDDEDYFADISNLRQEYDQIKQNSSTKTKSRLSLGLPENKSNLSSDDTTAIKRLIEQLDLHRKGGPDGNSIFCTEEELNAIQGCYGSILDLLQERSSTFEERANANVESPEDAENQTPVEPPFDMKSLTPHLEALQGVRDKFFLVEQQVRELIEQLELVERYKMESSQ